MSTPIIRCGSSTLSSVDSTWRGRDFVALSRRRRAVPATRRAICANSTSTVISTACGQARWLEAECHRNIEVIWLLRTLKPDFKTIADFRSGNRAAFRAVFRQFTLRCRNLNLFGRELLAVDGTRIKAVNNKDRNFTRNSASEVHQGGGQASG
jgi:Transposase domain (DUF772)